VVEAYKTYIDKYKRKTNKSNYILNNIEEGVENMSEESDPLTTIKPEDVSKLKRSELESIAAQALRMLKQQHPQQSIAKPIIIKEQKNDGKPDLAEKIRRTINDYLESIITSKISLDMLKKGGLIGEDGTPQIPPQYYYPPTTPPQNNNDKKELYEILLKQKDETIQNLKDQIKDLKDEIRNVINKIDIIKTTKREHKDEFDDVINKYTKIMMLKQLSKDEDVPKILFELIKKEPNADLRQQLTTLQNELRELDQKRLKEEIAELKNMLYNKLSQKGVDEKLKDDIMETFGAILKEKLLSVKKSESGEGESWGDIAKSIAKDAPELIKGAIERITPSQPNMIPNTPEEKVFTYIRAKGGVIDPDEASKVLGLPKETVDTALRNLEASGKIRLEPTPSEAPSENKKPE